MRQYLRRAVCLASVSLALGLVLTACAPAARSPHGPALPGRWAQFRHVAGVVDLVGPRSDGWFIVAAAGRLYTLTRAGLLRPVATGRGGYSTATGPEPYIAMAGSWHVAGTGCSFQAGAIFALQPGGRPGIIAIGAGGRARRFASLPGALIPTGITFDATGHFGHALLVTARGHAGTAVLAIGCTGGIRAITVHAPAMEGGITVAPASFGRYGGDLVAAGETSGRIFAVAPDGAVATLVASGLPAGVDIGVESTGFVPPGFGARDAAYLADRYTPGNKHPGTNSILRLPGAELVKAGVRAGDLLAATEASARTIVVRCGRSCTVRYIAIGPDVIHAEGHITFTGSGQ
ncbi:MAG TPA: hypothetical protein VG123_25430 [Streptosporangiaceae bacterium]|nr:hypothetical protein [Streptosporangiaceae bacterium]